MSTMYDAIMDLPLFKGVSHNQLSDFLEKTHIQFLRFEEGMEVVKKGEPCNFVKFIISGNIRFEYHNKKNTLSVSETLGQGNVLWPQYLYGMDTNYPATGIAEGRVSVMQFSKEQYFRTLQSEMIFLLNYLNYLSLHSQLTRCNLDILTGGTLREYIALLLKTVVHSEGERIIIHADIPTFRNILNLDYGEAVRELEMLKVRGLIDFNSEEVKIISRRKFLEAVENQLSK